VSGGADIAMGQRAARGMRLSANRSGIELRTGADERPIDPWVDSAIVVELVLAVLLSGIVVALDLPTRVELLADLGAVVLLGLCGWQALRSRRPLVVPYILVAFVCLLLIGAAIGGEPMRALVAAKNYLLLPAVALAIAALGPSERRVRFVLVTVLALVCIQFVVMAGQGFAGVGVDLIVGTFGDFSGPSTGFALEVAACLALGLYAFTGRPLWLVLAFVLPLASIWSAIRLVPFVLPIAGLVVAVAAWLGSPEDRSRPRLRRPLIAGLTAIVTTAAIFAGYAIFRPFDFNLVTSSDAIQVYAEDAETTSAPGIREAQREVVPGRKVQAETAMRLVNDGPVTLALGQGLGSTTYAENLGIEKPTNPDYVIVGYMDTGTLLVELGWLGLGLIVVAAVSVGVAAVRRTRTAPDPWTRALLVAYPGVLVAMGAGLVHGAPLRNIGSATIFWLLSGLVLAVVLNRSGDDGASRLNRALG
jgi:hypothetical protein